MEIINALDIPDDDSNRSTPSFTVLNHSTDGEEEEDEVIIVGESRSEEKTDEEGNRNKEDSKDIDLVAKAMQISKI